MENNQILFTVLEQELKELPIIFFLEPRRIIFNPINRTSISSIRIYVTDGLRRPVYLNHADTAFSLILKKVASPS